jgi:hypothetical protein
VTCTGSLYLWDDPTAGLHEIHRILARGGSAHLFEPHAEASVEEQRQIHRALRRETPLRRAIGPVFIRTVIKAGLRLPEIAELLDTTSFRGSYSIEKVTLADVPVWLHIVLVKAG